MTRLSQLQTNLLAQIAEAESGMIEAPADAKPTIAALIRRGLVMAVPQEGRASQLLITEQGREAIQPAPDPSETPPVTGDDAAAGEAPPAALTPSPAPKGKLGVVVDLLRRPDGARLEELMEGTGWQAHSVRGALAGAVKKKLGLVVLSEKTEGVRRYRIAAEAAA